MYLSTGVVSIVFFPLFVTAAARINKNQPLNLKALFICFATYSALLAVTNIYKARDESPENNNKKSIQCFLLVANVTSLILASIAASSCHDGHKILSPSAMYGAMIFFAVTTGISMLYDFYQSFCTEPSTEIDHAKSRTPTPSHKV